MDWLRLGVVLALAGSMAGGLLLTAAPVKRGPDLSREGAPVGFVGQKVMPFQADDTPLPEGAIARLGSTRFRHSGGVWCLAFSPDGKTLASEGTDGVIRLWDLATGQPPRVFAGCSLALSGMAFSPDGTTLAATDWGQKLLVRLWDVASGVERLQVDRGAIGPGTIVLGGPVAYSPDGKTLAAIGPQGEVCLWDTATGREKGVLGKHEHQNVVRLVFAPDGRTLASCGQDGTVRLWDAIRHKPLHVLRSRDNHVGTILFCRDGKWLLSGGVMRERANDPTSPSQGSGIRIWDVATGKQLRVLTGPTLRDCVSSLALAPDGRTLAIRSSEGVELWDLRSGRPLRSLPVSMRNRYQVVQCLCFSPDGKLLAGSIGSAVCLWDPASGRLLTPDPTEATGGIFGVALSSDGRLLAAGDQDGTVGLWDLPSGQLRRRLRGHEWTIVDVAVSPDGRTVATASQDGSIRIWDSVDGHSRHTLRADPRKDTHASCLAFSPDGKLLVSGYFVPQQGGSPRGLRLWDPVSGKEVQHLPVANAPLNWFTTVAFSADGQRLTATANSGETYRWQAVRGGFAPGKVICRSPAIGSTAYSPEEGSMATTDPGQEGITLWDMAAGRPQRVLAGPEGFGRKLVYSPDGRYLASGAGLLVGGGPNDPPRDYSLRVYELASGQEVLRWPLPERTGVGSLTFTPDNRALVAGMTDSTVLVWAVFPTAREPLRAGLWEDLAHPDAHRAHRALATLATAGDQGVALLGRQLQAVRRPEPGLLARLLADLDSDDFHVREKATRELARVAEGGRPALERARAGLSPEARRRVDHLLEGLDSHGSSGEVFRTVRAITALESIGTPKARRLLETLAQGAPEARLTREAEASLRRLDQRRASISTGP